MTTEADFVQEIASNPEDLAIPAVFADWLEDRDDPRAKLVRTRIDWCTHVRFDPGPAGHRFDEEIRGDAGAAFHSLATIGAISPDERGLLRLELLQHLETLATIPEAVRAWVGSVVVSTPMGSENLHRVLGQFPHLRRLIWRCPQPPRPHRIPTDLPASLELRLELIGPARGDEQLEVLAALPDSLPWRELSLVRCGMRDANLIPLGSLPALQRLRHLDLSANEISNEGVRVLTHHPGFTGLEELSLALNPITDPGVMMLLSRGVLVNLRELNLTATGMSLAGCAAWLRSTVAPPLTARLHTGNRDFSYTRRAMTETERSVELSLTVPAPGWGTVFASIPLPPQVTAMRLMNLSDGSASEVAPVLAQPGLMRLHSLVVSSPAMTPAMVEVITRSESCRRLNVLSLSGPQDATATVAMLSSELFATADRIDMPGLNLELKKNTVEVVLRGPTLAVVEAFVHAPGAGRVQHLKLTAAPSDSLLLLAQNLPRSIDRLTLVNTLLDEPTLSDFLRVLPANRLSALALDHCGINDRLAQLLAEASSLEGLMELLLVNNLLPINGPGMSCLRERFERVV